MQTHDRSLGARCKSVSVCLLYKMKLTSSRRIAAPGRMLGICGVVLTGFCCASCAPLLYYYLIALVPPDREGLFYDYSLCMFALELTATNQLFLDF